jgi:hypothetical protein
MSLYSVGYQFIAAVMHQFIHVIVRWISGEGQTPVANPSGAIVIWLKANKQINGGPEYGSVQIGVHVGSWRHPGSVYLMGLADTCDLRIGAAIL